MTRKFTRNTQVLTIVSFAAIEILAGQPVRAQSDVTINPTDRTVTTSNFTVTWNTGVDTEAITSLSWMGGSNLTGSLAVNTCGNGYTDVEYFGNSEAPPDPTTGLFLPV